MGLISAALGAAGGVMADQWKEFFTCDSLSADQLMVRGQKRVGSRSSNTKGSDNVISKGSVITVADGQCMLITEQGRVAEVCATPGEYIYDSSTEPSIFAGSLGTGIVETFKNIGKRFTFGGEAPKDQRVYYINIKELVGNKYGTASPVPFRVVDKNIGLDVDIAIKCFGEYSYKIADPILFYTNVAGNTAGDYEREAIDSQLKTELLTALQPTFAKIGDMGIRYSSLPGHTQEIADVLNEVLSEKWRRIRGLEIVSFGVSSVKANEEDEAMIKDLQKKAVYRDPNMAAAGLASAQAEAMVAAANNQNAGPMMAFAGMNMANMAGGMNAQGLFAMGQQQAQAAQAAPAPAPAAPAAQAAPAAGSWTCACGHVATGKFCPECGAPKPAEEGWTCSCGAVNKGKFCPECGAKKPAGIPQYRCDKCGWEPEDKAHPPKFCPECGDPFDDGDIVS